MGESFGTVGAVLESFVRTKWPVRHTKVTTDVVPNRSIRVEYVDGWLRREALWTFLEEDGNTRIAYRWRTNPAGSLRFMAPVLSLAKSHSRVTTAGLTNLQEQLSRRPESPKPTFAANIQPMSNLRGKDR